jgi:5'-3' exonuclease
MGIPRFFYYCFNNFESSIELVKGGQLSSESFLKKEPVDFIYFDLNAIIHPVCQRIFKYGSHEDKSLLKPKIVRVTGAKLEQVYKEVCDEIEKYVNIVKPQKGVFIAIDGVAGMSKCTQQRQRRFRSGGEKTSDENKFDPNCISTGTVFMDKLGKYVDNFLKLKLTEEWKDFEIIFSNDKVPGEGEHKILKHLKLNNDISGLVVSPDADLFMLCLGCLECLKSERKIYVMRENVYTNVDCAYFIVQINSLADEIVQKITDDKTFETQHVIRDFIFFCFMLGNDFLPNIPCIDLSHKGLDLLFQVYSRTLKTSGLLIDYKTVHSINKKAFVYMLKEISQLEHAVLVNKYKSRNGGNDPFISKCLLDQDGDKIDMEKYRRMYYLNKVENEGVSVDELCKEYIRGMIFVFKYYTDTIPSWTWCFKNHFAPFAGDLARVIEKDGEVLFQRFVRGYSMSTILQLMCILPPKSRKLLPECVQKYFHKDDASLGNWMQDEVEIDCDFKMNEYEGIVKLPFIEHKDFEDVLKKEEKNLSVIENSRNTKGKVFVYYQELNPDTKVMECVVEMVTPSL